MLPRGRWRIARSAAAAVAALLALTAAAGCQHGANDDESKELFRPEEEARQIDRMTEVQSAIAARKDGTLRPHHFDQTALNSLGRGKLDLMLKDEEASLPLVVYLDLPADDQANARRESVRAYLKARGVQGDQLTVQAGANPADSFPAAPSMRMMHMLDAGTASGTNPEPSGSSGGASAGK